MFKIAICDDEINIHKLVEQFLQKISARTSFVFDVHCFFSGEELLQHYKEHGPYAFHILILDVEMGGMTGIDAACKIRSLPNRDVQIVFLTSYTEYMMDSFEVQAFQYLLKPVSFILFEEKIVKLCRYILSSTHKFFVIKTEENQLLLRSTDIIAIVKVKHSLAQNRLKVIVKQQAFTIIGTLSEYSNKMEYPFVLIHRSIIVNMEHIRKFSATSVLMSNEQLYPVGRSHIKRLREIYANFVIAQIKEGG
ncbi:UNVERIFIED_CONTAM: two-component system response regulator LytT [Paenibacillus sp. PvR008]